MMKNLTLTASIGTNGVSPGSTNFSDLGGVTLGELSLAYKTSSKFSFGIGHFGALDNVNTGYYNEEGLLMDYERREISCNRDKDKDDDHEEEGHDDDGPRINIDKNMMAFVTYKVCDKLPFFVQAGAGYSIDYNVPAYFAKIGYSQNVFSNLGVHAGFRFSDVLHQLPDDGMSKNSSFAVKGELGLNWNF